MNAFLSARQRIIFGVIVAVAGVFGWPTAPMRAQTKELYVPNEILIHWAQPQKAAEGELMIDEYRFASLMPAGPTGWSKALLRDGETVSEAIIRLQQDPAITSVQPNYRYEAADFVPNDQLYHFQWNFDQLHASQAWELDQTEPLYGGDPGVVVAVLDTGIAYENYSPYVAAPDFGQTHFVAGWDFINDDAHANDDHGHGTHMAGTIAQSTNNSQSEAGLAFQTTLMPIKVLGADGSGTTEAVAQGIAYAVSNGADVINLSLAATLPDPILEAAIQEAVAQNVVIIAAAGNEGRATLDYPAAYNGVISVGATRYDLQRPGYSNYGPGLQVMAPGGDFSVDQNSDGYLDGILQQSFTNSSLSLIQFSDVWAEGTSSATAHVSGAAALLLSAGAAPEGVRDILVTTAHDLGPAGYDTDYGFGVIDIQSALQSVVADTLPPVTTLTVGPDTLEIHNGYYATAPILTLSATDSHSGVGVEYYRWDDQVFAPYTEPLVAPEGIHQLSYYAVDRAGNAELLHTQLFKVDTLPPVFANIIPAAQVTVQDKVYTLSGEVRDTGSGVATVTVAGRQVTVEPDGTFRTRVRLHYGRNSITMRAQDRAGQVSTPFALTIASHPQQGVIVGARTGGGPQVRVFSPTGQLLASFFGYASTFRGGVTAVLGDVDGDLEDEIIIAPGPGGGPQIRVFDKRGNFEKDFFAYPTTFRGGVSLAVGDVDGDSIDEIITAPMGDGGPNIRIFGFRNGQYVPTTQNFMAYAAHFRGGVSLAAGDLDADGKVEIITAPLKDGGPQLRIFGFRNGQFQPVIQGLMAYAPSFRGGVTLAAGDLDADGRDEIITGVAGAGGPHVRIFDRKSRQHLYTSISFLLL